MAVKSGSAFDLSKITSNITAAKKLYKEKNDKNMKRVCKSYGQVSTDSQCRQISMPISKTILLGCGTGLWDRNCISYAGGLCMFKKSHIQNTFGVSRYHEVGKELLTAELVNRHSKRVPELIWRMVWFSLSNISTSVFLHICRCSLEFHLCR